MNTFMIKQIETNKLLTKIRKKWIVDEKSEYKTG